METKKTWDPLIAQEVIVKSLNELVRETWQWIDLQEHENYNPQRQHSQIRLDWSETCPSLTDLDIGPDIEERVQPMGLKVRCELGKFTKYIHSLHQVKYVRLASPSSTQRVISGFVHNQAKKTRPVMGRPRATKWSPNSATWTCLGSSFNLQAALVMIMA